jgi:hypothetical protein
LGVGRKISSAIIIDKRPYSTGKIYDQTLESVSISPQVSVFGELITDFNRLGKMLFVCCLGNSKPIASKRDCGFMLPWIVGFSHSVNCKSVKIVL